MFYAWCVLLFSMILYQLAYPDMFNQKGLLIASAFATVCAAVNQPTSAQCLVFVLAQAVCLLIDLLPFKLSNEQNKAVIIASAGSNAYAVMTQHGAGYGISDTCRRYKIGDVVKLIRCDKHGCFTFV